MDGAAAYAAQRPVFGSFATADHAQHREPTIAFGTMGSDCRGGLRGNQRFDLRHDTRFPLAPLCDGGLNSGCVVAPGAWFKAIDAAVRALDRDRPVPPGKTDCLARKCGAIAAKGFMVGSPDSGVPKTAPSLDALNSKLGTETGHFGGPKERSTQLWAQLPRDFRGTSQGTLVGREQGTRATTKKARSWPKECDPVHKFRSFCG